MTPYPSRSSPRPRVHSLIVVFYWIGTSWCRLIRPPGRKLRPISYPSPAQKIRQKSPSKNNATTSSPGRFSPNPVVLRLIVMLSVLETGRSVRFRPTGRKMKAIPPPLSISLLETEPLRLSQAVSARANAVACCL